MKVKELIAILKQYPDAEVVHYEYSGCLSPLVSIGLVTHESEGDISSASEYDRGDFVDSEGRVKREIVILETE